MRRFIVSLVAAVAGSLLLTAPVAAAPGDDIKNGDTVVSFTFDGTYKGQDTAARILADHNMAGTFYVNSGYVNYPAYLNLDQLQTIARERNEIGGASTLNNRLMKLPREEMKKEVCNDRATLSRLGFQVTSFSYPYGESPPRVKSVVQECGYNSGREVAGLYETPSSCASCPGAETIPPNDDFRIRTAGQTTDIKTMERQIHDTITGGGGWVPFVFNYICICPDKEGSITPEDFAKLVRWVANRDFMGAKVRTVDQVMGGSLKPVVGTPLKRLVPDGWGLPDSTPIPMSRRPAWTLLGLGIGQSQIVFIGLVMALAVIVTYRLASRGNRYRQDRGTHD